MFQSCEIFKHLELSPAHTLPHQAYIYSRERAFFFFPSVHAVLREMHGGFGSVCLCSPGSFFVCGRLRFFRCTLGMHLNRWRVKAEHFLPNSGLYPFFFYFYFFGSLLFKIVCFPVCLQASFSCRIIVGCVSKHGPIIMLSYCWRIKMLIWDFFFQHNS